MTLDPTDLVTEIDTAIDAVPGAATPARAALAQDIFEALWTAVIDHFVDRPFAGSDPGLVPSSDGSTTKFLRGDGTFAVPGGGTDVPVVNVYPLDFVSGTDTLVPDAARATFVGYAWKDVAALASASVRWRVSTGGGGYSTGWAEVAIAKGSVNLGGNPTLTVVGYASIQSSIQAGTGNVTTTVSVSSGQSIARGDGLWLVWATDGGLSPTLVSLGNDSMQHGMIAYLTTADWRPSSNVGSAVAWTVAPTTSTNSEPIRGTLLL
jgi:hypothetical protein